VIRSSAGYTNVGFCLTRSGAVVLTSFLFNFSLFTDALLHGCVEGRRGNNGPLNLQEPRSAA